MVHSVAPPNNHNMSVTPKAVVVLCGKRKSGKDYVAAKLVHLLVRIGVSTKFSS